MKQVTIALFCVKQVLQLTSSSNSNGNSSEILQCWLPYLTTSLLNLTMCAEMIDCNQMRALNLRRTLSIAVMLSLSSMTMIGWDNSWATSSYQQQHITHYDARSTLVLATGLLQLHTETLQCSNVLHQMKASKRKQTPVGLPVNKQ